MKRLKYLKYSLFAVLIFPFVVLGEEAPKDSAPWVGGSLEGFPCSGKDQGYGPFDYTVPSNRVKIKPVEAFHYTSEVENLISGHTGGIADDLDYTLRAVPNHHKALLSLIRYKLKLNDKQVTRAEPLPTPVECYLQRAVHFVPKDAISYSLYAYYMQKINQWDKAARIYEKSLQVVPDNAKIEYSYGLLLIQLHQYDKALEYAQKAYTHSGGKAPNGLKNKLIKLGVWRAASDDRPTKDSPPVVKHPEGDEDKDF